MPSLVHAKAQACVLSWELPMFLEQPPVVYTLSWELPVFLGQPPVVYMLSWELPVFLPSLRRSMRISFVLCATLLS